MPSASARAKVSPPYAARASFFVMGLSMSADCKPPYSLIASPLSGWDCKLTFMKTLKERALEARRAWEARENQGEDNRSAFARAVGKSHSAIHQIEEGKTLKLRGDTLTGYQRASGFNSEWLENGRGPRESASGVREGPAAYLTIPMHSAHASAGHGAKNGDVTEIGSLLFRPRSLAKRQIDQDGAQVWYVKGASMFPRLREGDAVLFDTNDTEPADGKLYVIEWGKERQTYVKRLYHELDGAMRVVSDNPAPEFRDRIVQPGDPGFRVLGRVRWIGSWED